MTLTFSVRVTPGASRSHVGGAYGDALRVRVMAPALEGRANQAVVEALAQAFEVRTSAVTIRSGASGRTKIVTIDGDSGPLTDRLNHLRQQ